LTRAWPFEHMDDTGEEAREPLAYLEKVGPEDAEAVVIRIGYGDAQLVVVAGDGAWRRWVYRSLEQAERVAAQLGIPVHTGQYPESTRVRMNAHRRAREDFDAGAYPEQGAVGPVRAYPENRPRMLDGNYPRGTASRA
jgi:hypothetical protein